MDWYRLQIKWHYQESDLKVVHFLEDLVENSAIQSTAFHKMYCLNDEM
jgi:hypothetical protein